MKSYLFKKPHFSGLTLASTDLVCSIGEKNKKKVKLTILQVKN